jgi:uncharacterized protein YcbK (DUF882 family)
MKHYSRRQFLSRMTGLAVAGAALAVAPQALAAQPAARSLAFEHTSTGQHMRITYAVGNRYLPEALTRLNAFLRDHHNGAIGRMDPRLFDLLHRLQLTLGADGPFEIICGYRCPKTNAQLRAKGRGGVAKNSLHMEGKAIDLRLAGTSLRDLRDAAVDSRIGGVGFYPGSKVVHVDTGPVRSW